MTLPIERIIESFCDALHPGSRYETLIHTAETEGYPQLVKMFRAVIASEIVRERLLRRFLPHSVDEDSDYFVCPNCAVIYKNNLPEQCPIDETPSQRFQRITQ